jgi:hypothetical protein
VEFDLYVPAEHEIGVPAEVLEAWSWEHGFVLTFGTLVDPDRYLATARVRVPSSSVLEIRDALEQAIRDFELQFGEIHRPRRRGT